MTTKLEYRETRDLVGNVVRPFRTLSAQVSQKHKATLVSRWVKQELYPRVEKWEAADPNFFKNNSIPNQTLIIDSEYYSLPQNRRWPMVPENMVTFAYIVDKYAGEAIKEELQGALQLTQKANKLQELLSTFLTEEGGEKFTSLEQAIFSLPELKSFAPTKCQSQKRPRVFKVPSDELVRLMREAVRLKEALGAKGE